jgi:NADH dehydrogenase
MTASKTSQPQIIVLGAGFGGLRATRQLAQTPAHVTLIDRHNYHLFQPLLYQVATSGLAPEEIAYPVRTIFHNQKNFDFRLCDVHNINLKEHRLETSTGSIPYDYLIISAGGETNFFGLQSVQEHGFGLKNLNDAVSIRNHLLQMFERAMQETDPAARQARLTFVVAGGGPTGVECAGAISELVRMLITKDYPHLKLEEVRVILLEAADRLLAHMPDELSQATLKALNSKNVDVRFGTAVDQFDGHQVKLKDGSLIPCQTVIWAAGVRSAAIIDSLGSPQASQKRVKVLPTLQLPDHPEVFVIGDAAYLEDNQGKALPMVAPVAMQQGICAAKNLAALLNDQPLNNFEYKDPGSLATIGRKQAVASLAGLKFKGWFAWIVWLFVHLMQLVGFRNRVLVLLNWAWEYFFYDRGVRLILKDESGCD